jgi:hypothetical protein
MFALTLFVIYFCFASCLLHGSEHAVLADTGRDTSEEFLDEPVRLIDALYEAYFGQLEDVTVADDAETDVSLNTVVQTSDEATEADDCTWETFDDLSLSALRKIAKTLSVPRYTRLERHELVFEINTRKSATSV